MYTVSSRCAFRNAVIALYYLISRLKCAANASKNLIALATRVAAYVLSLLRGCLLNTYFNGIGFSDRSLVLEIILKTPFFFTFLTLTTIASHHCSERGCFFASS